MAIKLPENHARLSARCHIRSFPLTGSYEAVISGRERERERKKRGVSLTLSSLSLPLLPFPADPLSPTPLCSALIPLPRRRYRSGRLLSHDGNIVGDKVEVTSAVNSQKLFTKLLAGSEAGTRMICGRARACAFESSSRLRFSVG